MSIDNTRLNYLSTWDIDQMVATDSRVVGAGATALYTIPSTSVAIPVYEVQLKVSGRWYQAGTFSTAGTLATLQNFYTYISGGQIFINSSVAGTARYFVWTDKVDY